MSDDYLCIISVGVDTMVRDIKETKTCVPFVSEYTDCNAGKTVDDYVIFIEDGA